MKHIVFVFAIILISVPCLAQWNYIDLNVQVSAFGAHDTLLFISSTSNNELYRYSVANGYVVDGNGIDFSQGNITSFASLGQYLFAGMTRFWGETSIGPGTASTSSDNGLHWTAVAGGNVCSNGKYLYCGDGNSGIYRSEDSGKFNTWDNIANISADNLATIGINIFASNSMGIWRSIDTGNNWTKLTSSITGTMMQMDSLLLITSNGSVTASSDSGEHWAAVTVDSAGVPMHVNCLSTDGTHLFAGTTSGVFLSLDGGSHWRMVGNDKLAGPDVIAMGVFDDTMLAVDISYNFGLNYAIYIRPIPQMTDSTQSMVVLAPANDSLAIYPNPATGMVTILAGQAVLGVRVLNVLGEQLLDVSNPYSSEASFDLSHFASGTYFIEIETAKGMVLRKIARK
ncbi:MAG TPA: T9SS type A sorting domain-containing protein [Candidatus Kapabacteria bacterium]